MAKQVAIFCVWLVAIALPIILFAMPWFIAVPFALGCFWLIWRRKSGELVLVLVSLLFVFAGVEVLVRMMADDLFYAAHIRFARDGSYLSNVNQTVKVAHGDLAAVSTGVGELAQPHDVTFITDDQGFRNSASYTDQPYILLGDSFVAGVNNSAENLLVTQINKRAPGRSYSLGYPGSPDEYEHRAMDFLQAHPDSNARFIWYVFEGNDLEPPGSGKASLEPTPKWQRFFKGLSPRQSSLLAPRFLKTLYKRIGRKTKGNVLVVDTQTVGGQRVGFFRSYIDMVQRDELVLRLYEDKEVMARTACVFVIPTKYHTYQPILEGADITEASVAYRATVKAFAAYPHVKVVDLTGLFQRQAIAQLEQGELLYWPDDTHWNANGIGVAAQASMQCIQ